MALRRTHLDDKYTLEKGQIYITGTQALVRLPLMQAQRDLQQGIKTAGFISGYRGSPLGGFDQALWAAQNLLDENHIQFTPGVNEDLGATAVWGSQQTPLFKGTRVDGVFGMWYGKGPGVDRTGDVFKHANAAGTSTYGGVLALAGDDHTCKSSTLPHQSEYSFMDASIPVLVPSNVQDILDLGLYGWAMSRYSGCWIGFKVIADTVDTSASVTVDPNRVKIQLPQDFIMPEDGLNIRWPDAPLEQEKRLRDYKLQAAQAFVKANGLDKIIIKGKSARLGIVTCGKSYHNVRQALGNLGISEDQAAKMGISLYKLAMNWPIEPTGLQHFASGLEEILVVEDKRPVIESQVKEILFNFPETKRPRVLGKKDEKGNQLLRDTAELQVPEITHVLAQRLLRFTKSQKIQEAYHHLDKLFKNQMESHPEIMRLPYYCSGCPHNTSTLRLPEGSRAVAGIGCHYMAAWISPHTTATFTQMGGEGVPWIGQAPFTDENHIFANLGDGTYYHSGIMAIRAAVAAGVNITYKILYNDAVAMTGGQHVDGPLDVPMITRQLAAEGVRCIKVVSNDPGKYNNLASFAPGVTLHHRDELPSIQEDIRYWPGVSAILYDQTCAAELRRRRKRGLAEDPSKRIFINQTVCEGCGDCSEKSNCLSVHPVETEFGRKRRIDQSSCNKDYSCVKGFCPSFVSVEGAEIRKSKPPEHDLKQLDNLPEPECPKLDKPYSIYLTGIGGTGVLTVGALVGMAAHLDKKGCSIVDMAGLAQKGGAVVSHIRIAERPEDIHATRIAVEGMDLLLGCDMVVASYPDTLANVKKDHTHAIINDDQTITGHFIGNPDYDFKHKAIREAIQTSIGKQEVDFLPATQLATQLMGDTIATNLFMLGFAYQKGFLPISAKALEEAIRLNKVAVEQNIQATRWGRLAALNLEEVEEAAGLSDLIKSEDIIPKTLEEMVSHRRSHLNGYQNKAYADRYEALVRKVEVLDKELGRKELGFAVANYYSKLLAYKDEYEVARLYTDGRFKKNLNKQFEGDYKLTFYLAPPLISKRDSLTGEPIKREFGGWMYYGFQLLAKLKGLRGTAFDLFGRSAERQLERRLIREYEDMINMLLEKTNKINYDFAVEMAQLPEHIRGYGHVKQKHLKDVEDNKKALMTQFEKLAT